MHLASHLRCARADITSSLLGFLRKDSECVEFFLTVMKKWIDKTLFYWFLCGEILPNLWLSFTEPMTLLGRITNIILPLGIIGLYASISKQVGKTIWLFFPYTLLAAFQIVLLSLYGNGIISVDMFLNVVTTNSNEAIELLSRLWPTLIFLALLYLIPPAVGTKLIFDKTYLSRKFIVIHRKIFACTTFLGVILLGCCYGQKSGYDIWQNLYPLNVEYNMYLAHLRYDQSCNYYETSANYKYDAQSVHDSDSEEKYILVIGETSRADNWEIFGYKRHTNPRLAKRKDLIIADKAYSESNTTHKSVPMLLSNVDAHNFDNELYKVKSLITAFKEAGFSTAFISNQMPNHSYIDFFGNEADTTIFVKLKSKDTSSTGDDSLLPYIKNCLDAGNKKQLIVVHTYGSHFNYRDRYSDQDRTFLPDNFNGASKRYRKELVNAYDNTIVATDRLLNSIIEMLDADESMAGLIYTSDHGEDIFDDGIHFLHASPLPTKQQLHVPLLIWLSPEYTDRYPEVVNTLIDNTKDKISTSRSFCPTAMTIGGVSSKKVNPSDDLGSPDYKTKPLYYLNDHNRALPLRSILK